MGVGGYSEVIGRRDREKMRGRERQKERVHMNRLEVLLFLGLWMVLLAHSLLLNLKLNSRNGKYRKSKNK